MHYSALALIRNAFSNHRHWQRVWRNPDMQSEYDVVIVGAGGHGLATAYYLAKNHGITNVAVIEKGWLGGGNTGRNTSHIRSNYVLRETSDIYGFSRELWCDLSSELNFNQMLNVCDVMSLLHSRDELEAVQRQLYATILLGNDSEILSVTELKRKLPCLNVSADARYPIVGALNQRNGATARHDALAWAYARATDALGIHIFQNCEVTGLTVSEGVIKGVETSSGPIRTGKVALAVAGHSSVLAATARVNLPMHSITLQAMVTEPVKPILDGVFHSSVLHVYGHQSEKGEIVLGGAADRYASYGQRGSMCTVEENFRALLELFPSFKRLRLMRQWAGMVDITPDANPIIGETPVKGLYIDCGWGTGGFKAITGTGYLLAHTIANNSIHPILKPFSLDRFSRGRLIFESAQGVAH